MERAFYLDLAKRGLRMPIAAHLCLAEQPDPDACLADGKRMGRLVAETARRYGTPLAFPLMDLRIEKRELLTALGLVGEDVDTFHFAPPPEADLTRRLSEGLARGIGPQLAVYIEAVRQVARSPDLLPIAMVIGPFSLATKLMSDPISPVFLAGTGASPNDEPEIALFETCLDMARMVVRRSVRLYLDAGAQAVCVCEPAACQVYLSPDQIAVGADIFERYVMQPHRELRALLHNAGVDLIFHNCGELSSDMIRAYGTLDPAILSLGSSVDLPTAAALVPRTTVLFGNLPSKQFYSDAEMPAERVRELTHDLHERMAATGHPFILGSECDVLHVDGAHDRIVAKVAAMCDANTPTDRPATAD